jgi:hypothetical protein
VGGGGKNGGGGRGGRRIRISEIKSLGYEIFIV